MNPYSEPDEEEEKEAAENEKKEDEDNVCFRPFHVRVLVLFFFHFLFLIVILVLCCYLRTRLDPGIATQALEPQDQEQLVVVLESI